MKHIVLLFSIVLGLQSLSAQNCFFTTASNIEATPGSNICLKVNVHNYENISAMQYTINWDTNVLDFTSSGDYSLPGLSASNFGLPLIDFGVLTFSWADPSFVGSDLVDRTHIYSICFDVVGDIGDSSLVDFTSSHTNIEIVDGNQQTMEFNKIAGKVSVLGTVNSGENMELDACIIDPSCSNNETGNVRLIIEGGEDPLNINWEGPDGFTFSGNDFDVSTPGLYFITVTDDDGITKVDSFDILDGVPRLEQDVVKDVRCFGQQNGSISITIGQGTPPYSFEWNNNSTAQNLSGLLPGNYSVTFTDSVGCSDMADFVIAEPDSIIVSEVQTICPSLNMSDGEATLSTQGGVAPYNYFWSNGDITNIGTIDNYGAGDHSVTVSDANNCPFIERTFTLETGIDSVEAFYIACGGNDIPLITYTSNVTSYEWSPADLLDCTTCAVPNVNTTMDTTVILTVTTSSGCEQSAELIIVAEGDCVWPGDMNDDGVANYLDIIWAGLANQSNGPIRTNATTDFIGQVADDWNSSTPESNINFRHIDADGNGVIDELDVQVISDNYALEHNFLPPDVWGQSRDDLPPLFIEIADTVEDNTLLSLDIILGSSDMAIASAHGLGFQIQFDNNLVNQSDISLEFEGWMGNDLWSIDRVNMNNGLLEIGVTRNDLVGMNGAGKIGTLTLSFNTVSSPVPSSFTIPNAYLINDDEGPIDIKPMSSEFVIVDDFMVAIETIEAANFNEKISPNPLRDQLFVTSDRFIERFQMFDSNGKLIFEDNFENQAISLQNIAISGIYYLTLIGPDGVTRHKLVKL